MNNWFEQDNTVYSYHTFMFPFRWDEEKIKNFDPKKNGWEYKPFEVKTCEDYNEYHYFHDFAQRTLFNQKQESINNPSHYYEKDQYDGKEFKLRVKNDKVDDLYTLFIDGVSLRKFETGVAIFAINLKNYNHRSFEKVLVINDYGRRLYPQFLDLPVDNDYAHKTKNSFLPYEIQFADFPVTSFVQKTVGMSKIADYVIGLIGIREIKPLLDDRMFVISHVMDNETSERISSEYRCSEKNIEWYKFVFVDSHSLTCQNNDMRKSLLETATYDRWSGFGTLYGITRYSFVCLSDASTDFAHPVLNQHIRRHYFQMMSLILAVRASIIRFSDKVTHYSSDLNGLTLNQEIKDLYAEYIKFVNRIYFREISPQEQGIEMYNKAMDIIQIEKNIKDLDNEIAELFHFVEMAQQSELNKYMANISEKGIPLMIAGLIAGIFGMNTINFEPAGMWPMAFEMNWGTISLILIFGTLLIYSTAHYLKRKSK